MVQVEACAVVAKSNPILGSWSAALAGLSDSTIR